MLEIPIYAFLLVGFSWFFAGVSVGGAFAKTYAWSPSDWVFLGMAVLMTIAAFRR